MAKIQTSALINDIKGASNGSVFQGSRGGLIIKSKNNGLAKKTVNVEKAQTNFSTINGAWRNLSEEEKNQWNITKSMYQKKNAWGIDRNSTGFELFSSTNIKRMALGLPILINPRSPVAMPTIERYGVTTFGLELFAPNFVYSPYCKKTNRTGTAFNSFNPQNLISENKFFEIQTNPDDEKILMQMKIQEYQNQINKMVLEDSIQIGGAFGEELFIYFELICLGNSEFEIYINFKKEEDITTWRSVPFFMNFNSSDSFYFLIDKNYSNVTKIYYNMNLVECSLTSTDIDLGIIENFNFLPFVFKNDRYAFIDITELKTLDKRKSKTSILAIQKGYMDNNVKSVFLYQNNKFYQYDVKNEYTINYFDFPTPEGIIMKNNIQNVNNPYYNSLVVSDNLNGFVVQIMASNPLGRGRYPISGIYAPIAQFVKDCNCSDDISESYAKKYGGLVDGSLVYFNIKITHGETGQTLELPTSTLGIITIEEEEEEDIDCENSAECPTDFACIEGCCVPWYCWAELGEPNIKTEKKPRRKWKAGSDLDSSVNNN